MALPDGYQFEPVDRAGDKTLKGSRPFGPCEGSGPLLVPLGRNSTESGAVTFRQDPRLRADRVHQKHLKIKH